MFVHILLQVYRLLVTGGQHARVLYTDTSCPASGRGPCRLPAGLEGHIDPIALVHLTPSSPVVAKI